jgi:hypothetical protein
MYHPYFRGKLNELITIREMAGTLAAGNFVPIIEPVKEAINGLKRALDAVVEANGSAIVIVNPHYGDLSGGTDEITKLIETSYSSNPNIVVGILLTGDMTEAKTIDLCTAHSANPLALVHSGFANARSLAGQITAKSISISKNVFLEYHCGKLYRKHFNDKPRVLVRDGFQKRKNREHPKLELFSDLHETYGEEGMQGFGDFLIVGDEFSETGGPAYAVAIHLTFIDNAADNEMFVYHFVSDTQDTPKDPAGKFAEALRKMIAKLDEPGSKVMETKAVTEFREFNARSHFPGLGYVKKLSMQHHIETLHMHLK